MITFIGLRHQNCYSRFGLLKCPISCTLSVTWSYINAYIQAYDDIKNTNNLPQNVVLLNLYKIKKTKTMIKSVVKVMEQKTPCLVSLYIRCKCKRAKLPQYFLLYFRNIQAHQCVSSLESTKPHVTKFKTSHLQVHIEGGKQSFM